MVMKTLPTLAYGTELLLGKDSSLLDNLQIKIYKIIWGTPVIFGVAD